MSNSFEDRTEIRMGYHVPKGDRVCFKATLRTLPDLLQAVALCPERRIAIQAGGNVGVWAKELAYVFETVYSFEPDPLNVRCLVLNTPDNVICQQAALTSGVYDGCVDLDRQPGNIGAHETNWSRVGRYPSVAIDSLALECCDLIYLDIEGDELGAFKGASHTIAEHRPVVAFEDKGVKGTSKGQIEQWLEKEFGYEVVARPNRDVIMVAG
jgi:FkbM family methyltransferase